MWFSTLFLDTESLLIRNVREVRNSRVRLTLVNSLPSFLYKGARLTFYPLSELEAKFMAAEESKDDDQDVSTLQDGEEEAAAPAAEDGKDDGEDSEPAEEVEHLEESEDSSRELEEKHSVKQLTTTDDKDSEDEDGYQDRESETGEDDEKKMSEEEGDAPAPTLSDDEVDAAEDVDKEGGSKKVTKGGSLASGSEEKQVSRTLDAIRRAKKKAKRLRHKMNKKRKAAEMTSSERELQAELSRERKRLRPERALVATKEPDAFIQSKMTSFDSPPRILRYIDDDS
jgi:hypothetical protein